MGLPSQTCIAGKGVIVFVLVAIATSRAAAQASGPARQASVPPADEARFHVVHGWPILPENTMLDEVSAVAVDSRDDVFVLTRGGRKWPDSDSLDTKPISSPTVFLFDGRTGQQLAKWGGNLFALPHSITVDAHDNIWIADVALHQVLKLSHDGKLLLTIGERGIPGEDSAHFNRPTDVAVASDGSFYVSDGYRNSRVVKFAADGTFLLKWGTKGKGSGQLDTPHGIALDWTGKVFVLDRQNSRVQIFDGRGNYIAQWSGPVFVNPQDVKIARDGRAFIVNAGSETPLDRTGIVVLRPDGSLIERFGRYGNYDGQFVDIHWVAIASRGEIYTADFAGKRVQKFVRGKR